MSAAYGSMEEITFPKNQLQHQQTELVINLNQYNNGRLKKIC